MERELTMIEIRAYCGEWRKSVLDNCIEALLYFKQKGEKVCFNFNGHILHSENISYDSAYMEVFGRTKIEHDEYLRNTYGVSEREMTIAEVKLICGPSWRNHIDDYIKALLYFKEKGERVYWNFNGHILHSENISYDSAYMEVFGYTKTDELGEGKKKR